MNQLVEIDEHPKITIKLGNTSVIQKLIKTAVETNVSTRAKNSVVVSLIGKQKTYKSTHANMMFGTNFPQGSLGMEQTTKGILVESTVLRHGNEVLNLQCLDYEGFGSTGRNLQSQEEKALDNKLMLLAYSISNVVIFSMHAADVSPFRDFVQLMRMCVKGIRNGSESKKPSLVIFVNVSHGDTNTIINRSLNGGLGQSPDQIREGIHQFATRSLLAQQDYQDCKNYFSEVLVETMYPNQFGNETEGFIIEKVKELMVYKCFSSESQDTSLLYEESRWVDTISSINSNEQIEFASDVLGKISETTCSAKYELLKNQFELEAPNQDTVSDLNNLKSKLLMEYWKEAKGKFASEYGSKLDTAIQQLYDKLSKRVLNNQIVGIVQEFEKEMTKFLAVDNFSILKLNNFYSSCIENYEIHHSDNFASTQDFQRLILKIGTKYEELIEDYTTKKRNETEEFIRQQLKNSKIDYELLLTELENAKDRLFQFNNLNKEGVERWHQRLLSSIIKKKEEEETFTTKCNQLRSDIANMKINFLESLSHAETVEDMDLVLKKSIILLGSTTIDKNSVNEMEKFFKDSYEEQLRMSLPNLAANIEIKFKNSLDSSNSAESSKTLLQQSIAKIPLQLIDQCKTNLMQIFAAHTINKGENEYNAKNYKSAKEWFELYINQGFSSPIPFVYLGEMFKNGYGTSTSAKKAFESYMRAANMGHADSEFSVGLMYLNGEGIDQSQDEAKKWFEKAAQSGHKEATIQIENLSKKESELKEENSEEVKSVPQKPIEIAVVVDPELEIKQLSDNFLNKFSKHYIPITELDKDCFNDEEQCLSILELWGDLGLMRMYQLAPIMYQKLMNNLETLEKISNLEIGLPIDPNQDFLSYLNMEPKLFNNMPEEKCIEIASKLKCIPSRFFSNLEAIKKIIRNRSNFNIYFYFKQFPAYVKSDTELIGLLVTLFKDKMYVLRQEIPQTVYDCPDLYLKYIDIIEFNDWFEKSTILKSDRNFFLRMISKAKTFLPRRIAILLHASPQIRDDEDVVREAIRYFVHSISYASERLQQNLNLILFALENITKENRGGEEIITKYYMNNGEVILKAAINGIFVFENNLMKLHSYPQVRKAIIENDYRVHEPLLSDPEFSKQFFKANPLSQQLDNFKSSIRSERDIMLEVIQKRENRFGSLNLVQNLTNDADFMEKCIDCNIQYAMQLSANLKTNPTFVTKILSKHPQVLGCVDPVFHIQKPLLMSFFKFKDRLHGHGLKDVPFDKDYWEDLMDYLPPQEYIEKVPITLRNRYQVKFKSTRLLVNYNVNDRLHEEYKLVDIDVRALIEALVRKFNRGNPKPSSLELNKSVMQQFLNYSSVVKNVLENRLNN